MKREIRHWIRTQLGEETVSRLKGAARPVVDKVWDLEGRVLTPLRLQANRRKTGRKLEIGPGDRRIKGFETLSVAGGKNVDYVFNAQKELPFPDNAFSVVYASHILEHIPWYHVERTVLEWYRIVDVGGSLEVFVPDGLKICQAFVDAENDDSVDFHKDGWFKFNVGQDPCIWANGRIFSYGDGTGNKMSPNWHMALFSERFLFGVLQKAGFAEIQKLSSSDVRGHDHGWINLGFKATKS